MCPWTKGEERLLWETVTSILFLKLGRIIQSAAADQWLETASGPEASTANTTVDFFFTPSRFQQLPPSHHTVLGPREHRQGSIVSASPRQPGFKQG